MLVVLGKLEIPFQFPGIDIQGQKRIAVKIVALAPLPAIGRRRIPGRPERSVRRRVVRAGNPCRRSTNFPRVALPAFVTSFARARNGVEAPFALASIRVVASMKPRMPYSPPLTPTITRFFTASGASVML